MSQRLALLLADDHPAVLEGLSNFLGSFSDIDVVAKCSDGVVALNNIRKFAPNVAVLDMVMPRLTGLEILSIIRQSANETKAVILTAYASEADLVAAVERGASSIVHKDAALEAILHCIREAAQGRPWLSPEIAGTIARYQSFTSVASRILKPLTEREYQIAMLVSEGLSNKEIGHELSICEGTVKIHLHKIYEKTRLSNRTMLAALVKQYPAPKF
jgi:DNA-binding NarL/FixJ family response regulator